MALIRFAMRHPITMMMVVVALIGVGGLATSKMRRDIFPAFNLPQIYIIQNYNGMSPAQMEGLIVNQIELNLQYVDGIQKIESQSIQQIALIKVSFKPGTNMAEAMAAVVAQVNRAQATMPRGVLPPQIMRMDAGSVPIGYLVLTSKTVSMGRMADLAQQRIRPLLQTQVPGAVGTAPFGSNVRSIVITVNPDSLRSYNLTPQDVTAALMQGNTVIPAGNLYIKDQMPLVPTNAMVDSIQTMARIPLRKERNVYLGDVARISDATDINYGYGMVNGRKAVFIPIVKKNSASTLTVVADIRSSMDDFKNALPPEVDIRYEFDQSPTVVDAIFSVALEGAMGATLTGLMVLLFLRDWRSVLVVVFNIPLALLGAMFALWVTGNTTNIMTLGGLALAIGMLVDEATVSIENIHVQLTRTSSLARAVKRGSRETAVPRLLAMLCILSVFIPAFLMVEPVRSLFVPLALAVAFAMITSYLLSSTLVPVLSVWLLKEQPQEFAEKRREARGFARMTVEFIISLWPTRARRPDGAITHTPPEPPVQEPVTAPGLGMTGPAAPPLDSGPDATRGHEKEEGSFFHRVRRVFARIVEAGVRRRRVVIPAYLFVCFGLLTLLLLTLGHELFPTVNQGQFVLRFQMPPGTNFELTREAWIECLRTIQDEARPGRVKISMGFAGQQAPDYAMNNMILFMTSPGDGQMRVRVEGIGVEELQEKLRVALPKRLERWLAGVLRKMDYAPAQAAARARQIKFTFEPGDIVSQVMTFGSPTPIEVVASGHNIAQTREYVDNVLAELRKNNYLRDVQLHQTLDYPTVNVDINRQEANLSGVTADDVGKAVLTATSSSRMLARNYWIDRRSGVSYQVQVEMPATRMNSPDQVGILPVKEISPDVNLMVRDVAGIGEGTMVGEYDRTSMKRYLSITANVVGEDLGRAGNQVAEAVAGAGKPPRGVVVSSRGQVQPMKEMFTALYLGLGIAVLVILVLLTGYFQSWRLAVCSIGAVPGVLTGVALILFLTGTTLNIESFMGAIMSIGVSVSNSVMLVTFMANGWEQKGLPVHAAAVQGAEERLRPILMTASAMIIGMVPMSLGLESGSKMEAPLGRAVIGGLFVSTFATLLILPALFHLIMGDRKYQSPSVDPDDVESTHHDGLNEEVEERSPRVNGTTRDHAPAGQALVLAGHVPTSEHVPEQEANGEKEARTNTGESP